MRTWNKRSSGTVHKSIEKSIQCYYQAIASMFSKAKCLDLGIWMSLQSTVECMHQNARRDAEALKTTVQEAWRDLPVDTIQRVFIRIPMVYQLIAECGGDNVNVEELRGHCNIVAAPE
jgi:hypothetical protein